MPRRPRQELAGAVHHVIGKTGAGRLLFYDDADRQRYLQLLSREVRERKWSVLTFCLMTNHVHLLICTPEPDLGLGIKRAHEDFARSVNHLRELDGHVFGSRFYNDIVRTDRHLVGCLRYIARNPVRHGACRHPRDWRWSAHRALAGQEPGPSFLDIDSAYRHLANDRDAARVEYQRLVSYSDDALVADLERAGSDDWLIAAVDDFDISIACIAAYLQLSPRTVYRRIAAARVTQGSVASVTDGIRGTGPGASAEG
jgi:REP-associated tyrosine transposase